VHPQKLRGMSETPNPQPYASLGPTSVRYTIHCGEVSRGERMLYSGADPESYITKYTLVYKDYTAPPYQTKCRHGHLKHSSVAFGVLGLGFWVWGSGIRKPSVSSPAFAPPLPTAPVPRGLGRRRVASALTAFRLVSPRSDAHFFIISTCRVLYQEGG